MQENKGFEIEEISTKELKKTEIISELITTLVIVIGLTLVLIFGDKIHFPMHRKIMFGDKKISIDYNRKYNELSYYLDKDNNEYIFKNDKLVGYLKNINKFELNKESENDIKINNIEEITKLFEINLENYILEKNNNDYLYIKYINDIKTSDGIFVSLSENGTLERYESSKIGLFDNLITQVTKEEVEEYIKEEVSKMSKFSKYRIIDMVIDYKKRKYLVDCLIEIDENEMEIVYNL